MGADVIGADADLAGALISSAKDRAEQRWVSEAIRDALEPLCVELTAPEHPEVRQFSQVQHLATQFHGVLYRGISIVDAATARHPTPAVGGVPRREALRWLDRHEGLDRGWYAAPVGWVNASGEGVLAVAIRSALLRGATALAYAGAGIVADSVPAREWEETALKLQTVARALRTRELL